MMRVVRGVMPSLRGVILKQQKLTFQQTRFLSDNALVTFGTEHEFFIPDSKDPCYGVEPQPADQIRKQTTAVFNKMKEIIEEKYPGEVTIDVKPDAKRDGKHPSTWTLKEDPIVNNLSRPISGITPGVILSPQLGVEDIPRAIDIVSSVRHTCGARTNNHCGFPVHFSLQGPLVNRREEYTRKFSTPTDHFAWAIPPSYQNPPSPPPPSQPADSGAPQKGDIPALTFAQIRNVCAYFYKYEEAFDFVSPSHRIDPIYVKSNKLQGVTLQHIANSPNFEELKKAFSPERLYKLNLSNVKILEGGNKSEGTLEFRQHDITTSYYEAYYWVNFLWLFLQSTISAPTPTDFARGTHAQEKLRSLFHDVIGVDKATEQIYHGLRNNARRFNGAHYDEHFPM